jgi:sucrose phosphorylase
VPHAENVSYFGDGDEAHLVYNFSLPPLLLHALQTGSGSCLTEWAVSEDPPLPGCTYLNFTASHDGIGVRPLEGLMPREEIDALARRIEAIGGHVSVKSNRDGSTSPYELNITYFDAMTRPGEEDGAGWKVERFLTSQAIALGLRGIPAVYFHSLVATANDHHAVEALGQARAINRHKWNEAALEARLDDPASISARVLRELTRMLAIRSEQPAFHPDAPQQALAMSDDVFALVRTAIDGRQTLLHLSNLTHRPVEVRGLPSPFDRTASRDLLAEDGTLFPAGRVTLEPYQTRWLTVSAI